MGRLESLHLCSRLGGELFKGCDSFKVWSQGKAIKNFEESVGNIKQWMAAWSRDDERQRKAWGWGKRWIRYEWFYILIFFFSSAWCNLVLIMSCSCKLSQNRPLHLTFLLCGCVCCFLRSAGLFYLLNSSFYSSILAIVNFERCQHIILDSLHTKMFFNKS